jgi:hypothetical protein
MHVPLGLHCLLLRVNGRRYSPLDALRVASEDRRPAYTVRRVWAGVRGNKARCLARLMATESSRWCPAQTPVFLLGSILYLSEMYRRSLAVSL